MSSSTYSKNLGGLSSTPSSLNQLAMMNYEGGSNQDFAQQLSKEGKIVLSEEEYVKKVDFIIKRDYYPNLLVQDAERKESNNKLSLDEFLNKYTSEDNASFSEIMDAWKIRNKQLIERIYEKNAQSNVNRVILPIENINSSNIKSITSAKDEILMLEHKDNNNQQVMIYSSDQTTNNNNNNNTTTTVEKRLQIDEDEDIEKYKNPLMFYPAGIKRVNSEPPANRIIKHNGTRISDEVVSKNDSLRTFHEEKQFTLNEDPQAMLEKLNQINNSLSINGHLLEQTPIIHPSQSTEIMTWGTIQSSPFRVPETPQREVLSQKLAATASKNIRRRENMTPNQTYNYTRTPSSTRSFTTTNTPGTPLSSPFQKPLTQQYHSLSKAAQKLAKRHITSRFVPPSSISNEKRSSSSSTNEEQIIQINKKKKVQED